MERRAALDSTSSATMPSVGKRCSSVVMLQSGSVRRMSCRSTTTWLFAATAHHRSSWLNLASSQWLPNGSALRTESTTAGGKRQRTNLGQTLSTQTRADVDASQRWIVFVRHRNVRSHVRANHSVLNRYFWSQRSSNRRIADHQSTVERSP